MNDWHEAEEHVERAHEHFEAARWEEAESELRRALSLDPSRTEWHFNLGLTLEAAGRWAAAIRALLDAHRLDPEEAQTSLLIGVNYLRLDKPRRAVQWLERAHALESDAADPLVHLIEAHARLGEHDKAEVCFYMAVQLPDVDEALAQANLAESLLDRGLTERALWCLRRAVEIDPQLPRIHARLAEAHRAAGKLDRARQLYLAELRVSPGDIDTLLDLSDLLVEMNRPQEAAEKCRRVLELQPDNIDAHMSLGELALREGRTKEALASFQLALRLDPDDSQARRRSADALLRLGENIEARSLLREEVRLCRAGARQWDADALRDLGSLLLAADLPVDAMRVLRALVDRQPDDAAALHLSSVACFESGDRITGMRAARKAVRRDSALLPALHNLALANLQEDRLLRARCWLRRAAAIDPDDPALRRIGAALRVRSAIAWVRGAVRRRPRTRRAAPKALG